MKLIGTFLIVVAVAAAVAAAARATAPTPSLDLRVAAAGEIRVGDTAERVRQLWGRPRSVARFGTRVTQTYGFTGGTLTVYLERGRVRIVAVRETIRTTKGDRVGTAIAAFRGRWGGTTFRDCCAVGVRHVRVATRTRGVVFVATFRDGRLQEIALMSDGTFRACYVAECD